MVGERVQFPLREQFSHLHLFTDQKTPWTLGFWILQKLQHIGVSDWVIGHWWLTQSPAPLSSLESKSEPFPPSQFPWQPDSILRAGQKSLQNVCWKGGLWMTRHAFHLSGAGAVSLTKNKWPNSRTAVFIPHAPSFLWYHFSPVWIHPLAVSLKQVFWLSIL